MAEIRIEEAPVMRVFHNGKGAEVAESWTVKGETFIRRWACWFESAHGLNEGDIVTVVGLFGSKVDEWTDKQGQVRHTTKHSVNDAKVIGSATGSRQSEVQTPTWDAPGYNDESPF